MNDASFDSRFPARLPLILELGETDLTRASLQSRPGLSAELRRELADATLILVPWETFRDLKQPTFPADSTELHQFLTDANAPSLVVTIAVDDSEYSEVALHADIITLPILFVSAVAIPVVVNLLSEYLKKRLFDKETTADVKCDLIIEDSNGRTQRLHFEGPADTFETLVRSKLNSLPPPPASLDDELVDKSTIAVTSKNRPTT